MPQGAHDPAFKYPYTVLWDWITFYGWGFDVKLPFCWLTYHGAAEGEKGRSYAYISSDATPDGAWVFLWGRRWA